MMKLIDGGNENAEGATRGERAKEQRLVVAARS